MKRFVYFLIVIGVCAYLGRRYWLNHQPEVQAWVAPVIAAVTGKPSPLPAAGSAPANLPRPSPGNLPSGRQAPPGVYYMRERVSVTTDSGVIAVVPGEEVRLMQRRSKGRLRVTTGRYDLDVKESQVTTDFDWAQETRRHNPPAATLRR